MQKTLGRMFNLPDMDVSYAGMKDKVAIAEQTFSLRGSKIDPAEAERVIAAETDWSVLWTKRHGNKLRLGHLLGNRFTIVVSGVGPDAVLRAEAVIAALRARGAANLFGPQRFGGDGRNAFLGEEVLRGKGPRQPWLRRLAVASYQSALFNRWVALRLERGLFSTILTGDVAKKTDTGGLFDVTEAAVDQARFDRREITYTGPMFGKAMRPATGDAAALEDEVWANTGFDRAVLDRVRLDGTRRPAVLFLGAIAVEAVEEGIRLVFDLPKGAYATMILREITKSEVVGAEMDED